MKLNLYYRTPEVLLPPQPCSKEQWKRYYLKMLLIAEASLQVDGEGQGVFARKKPEEFCLKFSDVARQELYTLDSIIAWNTIAGRVLSNYTLSDRTKFVLFARNLKSKIRDICIEFSKDITAIQPDEELTGNFKGYLCKRYINSKTFAHRFVFKWDKPHPWLHIEKVLFHYNDDPRGDTAMAFLSVYKEVARLSNKINFPDYSKIMLTKFRNPALTEEQKALVTDWFNGKEDKL